MKDLKNKEHTCGVHHTADSFNLKHFLHGSHKQHKRVRRNVLKESKYVELVIVNDNKQYLYYNRNVKDTENRAKQIANFVDSVYRPLNIRIALVHIITWNDYDKIIVDSNTDKLLENFYKYAKGDMRSILKKASVKTFDNTMLLSRLDFQGSTVGKAYLNVMCTDKSTGIIQDHATNAGFTASTLAHEMGHNFGLGHDDTITGCFCKNTEGNCVMHSVSSGRKPMTTWSDCSVKTLNANLLKGFDSCLFNNPNKIYGDPVCGNGFTESGEECDCGTAEECQKYSAGCCNATTCKLNPGAECDEGVCCRRCKFLSQDIKCREKLNECDIPEYCTGKSGQCPENVYVQNGKPCSNGKGFCYNGICPTHEKQCKSFWGKDAVSGPYLCYKPNTQGDLYGNCNEYQDGTYEKCNLEDVLCGSLHCTSSIPGIDLPNKPIILNNGWRATYRTFFEGDRRIKCNKLSISTSDDIPNPGKTREGTKCGENRLCKDSRCIHVDELSWLLPLCQGNCSNHGVCTNKGYCVCDSLWTGSDCATAITCPPGTSCTTQAGTSVSRTEIISKTGGGEERTVPTTRGNNVKGLNKGEDDGNQTIIIAITIPIILFVILIAVVVVFLWRRGSKLQRVFHLRSIKSDKKNSLTRNAAGLAQGSPYIGGPHNDKSRAPTSPTNLGFESADHVSLPTTKFSGLPAKQPPRPAPSRPPVVLMDKRTSPFQTVTQTDSYKDVKSLKISPPKKPFLPPSVPKIKPSTPYGNSPDNRNFSAQVDSDPLPGHPPPQPPLQQKPIGQGRNRLLDNPPPHPFLKQESSHQALNQKQTQINSANVKNSLPLNPATNPFGKKKGVGNLDQTDQPESKQSVSKAPFPNKPPPHPFLKKMTNDSHQQELKKPLKPARPIPTPRTNLNNGVMQTDPVDGKTVNDSSAEPTSYLKGKPLVPTTKPKFSPTPSPRNRIVTPNESSVPDNKIKSPFRPPIVSQKPQFTKDTVEPMDSSRMPLKLPSHSSETQKQAIGPRPLLAPKPAGIHSVPVPPKKPTVGKVPLLPPGAKLR